VGTVVEEGRADKILVFHFKRKKQYKKLQGHRQPFTAVRISEIAFDGQSFKAPALEKKQAKKEKREAASAPAPKTGPRAQKAKGNETRSAAPAKKAAANRGKKSAAKKSAKKSPAKKK
jgi:large subunit ribosomal protein L21